MSKEGLWHKSLNKWTVVRRIGYAVTGTSLAGCLGGFAHFGLAGIDKQGDVLQYPKGSETAASTSAPDATAVDKFFDKLPISSSPVESAPSAIDQLSAARDADYDKALNCLGAAAIPATLLTLTWLSKELAPTNPPAANITHP